MAREIRRWGGLEPVTNSYSRDAPRYKNPHQRVSRAPSDVLSFANLIRSTSVLFTQRVWRCTLPRSSTNLFARPLRSSNGHLVTRVFFSLPTKIEFPFSPYVWSYTNVVPGRGTSPSCFVRSSIFFSPEMYANCTPPSPLLSPPSKTPLS